ncbi:MAG: glycogen debranching protein [Clostridia bacterium]|nr:glycogen debranching protein [Clostridia bacterium]
MAPLSPPGKRNLILSKVDESIEIAGKKYDIYTNIGKNYITEGYKYQMSFEKEYVPIYTYKIQDVIIRKYICMQYGKNTVTILYRVFNGKDKSKLILTPIVNFRDFHKDTYNHEFELAQWQKNRKLKLVVDKNSSTPIYINVSEGEYIKHENDSFKNMFYIEEEKRGLGSEENHVVPGRYEIEIEPNEQKDITFVASLEENIEEIDGFQVISKEIVRIAEIMYKSELPQTDENKDLIRDYIISADNFVVYRPSFKLHTIIAGYPWFLDWGRDTLISFEGLLLKTKRYEIAREVLQTMIRDIKYGLVPNGYSGYDNRPLYNSADSSLLLFEQIQKYINYTKDYEFIKKEIYPVLGKIIEAYCTKIDIDDNNIYLDEDGLISSGTETTQNTWMDAKIGNYVVTPRNGKAVEINSMWYNSLKIMENLCKEFESEEKSKKYKKLAEKCKKSFNEKFYNKRRKCLYDVLGDSKIRPNQLFAISLTYPVIEPSSEIAKEMFETVTKKLLNNYGLKTLAKGEENYIEKYEGDSFKRDMSYHQGITWPWLLGIYYDSFKKIVKAEKNKTKKKELEERLAKFVQNVEKTFTKEFTQGKTVGGIAELYDSVKPHEAKGTINQAWSIAEVFRIILN